MNNDFEENLLLPNESDQNLTDWDSPPKLKDLKADFDNSKPARDTIVSRIAEWTDYRKGTGSAAPKVQPGQSKVVPKLIRKQAEWRYAALSEPFLSTPDLFKVSPVSWEDQQGAVQNGLVLNNQFNTVIDRTALIDRFVRENVDKGTCVLRTGWDYQTEPAIQTEPIYAFMEDPSLEQVYQQMAQTEQTNPVVLGNYPQEIQDGYSIFKDTGVSYRLQTTGTTQTPYDKVIRNCPTVEVCNLANLYVDPACSGDINKASFVIYGFETSTAELKASGLYQNLEKINVNNSSPLTAENFDASSSDPNFQPQGKPRKRIVAYEYWGYWDINDSGTLRPIVATWVDNILIRMEENPYPDGKPPFVVSQYLPVTDQLYGEPDAELLKENQDIAGAVTRGMIDLLGKSANGQTAFTKGMLDSSNKKRFSDGEDYEVNPGNDPRSGIYQHVYPEIPSSAQFMLSLMNTDAESLTGVKAFSGAQGISGQGLGSTAAGVRGALDAASKREMGILRRLTRSIVEVGRKIIAMNAIWLNEQEVVRVTEEEFIPIRRDDLAGNYDLNLAISTAEQDEAKAQELAMMLQTLGNNIDFEMTKMILAEIARLRKMPDLSHRIAQFQPQPDPMEQQMQQMQMELLQAQINLTNAQASEYGAKGMLNQAKVATEASRSNQIQSQADKNSLEFLQTQNGVKHQQALEMEQAKGDNTLAATALKQQGTMDELRNKHNLSLLANHANTDLNHRSELQKMRAQASFAPKPSTGSSR